MKALYPRAFMLLIGVFGVITKAQAQATNTANGHILVLPTDIKWVNGPVSLPPGAQKAILEGDPQQAGLFTMRLKLPMGYKIMPHRHTADEHVTVIEGTFYMGVGEKFDEQTMMRIPTGGFAVMRLGTPHYGFAKQPCIVQVHGVGPWTITYINPVDDPRARK